MSERGFSVRVSAEKPGDMYLQLSALASIADDLKGVYYNQESLFLHYRKLDVFSNIEFVDQKYCTDGISRYVVAHKSDGISLPCGYRRLTSCFKRLGGEGVDKNREVFNVSLIFEAEKRRCVNQLNIP